MINRTRYFNDPEDSDYDYYAVINTSNAQYMGGFCNSKHYHSLEKTFKNIIPVGDAVKTYNLVLIQITDPDEVVRIQMLWDTPGESPYVPDWTKYPVICESPINDYKGKSKNEKHKTGIPQDHLKRTSVGEVKNEKPQLPIKNTAGIVIQGIFSSGKMNLDPKVSRKILDKQISEERATQLRIVFRGQFVNPAPNRLIECIRFDGKLIGRHLPDEDDMDVECTFTDYCRGNHAYQIQLTTPSAGGEGYGMINNSLIIEEV